MSSEVITKEEKYNGELSIACHIDISCDRGAAAYEAGNDDIREISGKGINDEIIPNAISAVCSCRVVMFWRKLCLLAGYPVKDRP
jgi:predicted RNase H-related nuclease YkuK (DUF458 family)